MANTTRTRKAAPAKKLMVKLPPLKQTIFVGGQVWNTESFLDAAVKAGYTAAEIAPYFDRSVAAVEQALKGRTREEIERREKMLMAQKVYEEAITGNSKILVMVAEKLLGYGRDAIDLNELPQPLIINFPTLPPPEEK
jgi:hypothetical protein